MVKKLLDQSTLILWISILLFMVKNQAEYGNNLSDNYTYQMRNDFFSLNDKDKFENMYLSGLKKFHKF